MAIEIVVQPSLPYVVVSDNPSQTTPDLSSYATLYDLNITSGSLDETIANTGSYLYNLINTSAAGVSSLNGASGILTLIGTGGVYVTTAGQVITVSGSDGTSQSVDLNGLISTGSADLRYYPLTSNPSGYLNTLSGLSIQYVIDVSGALSLRLAQTGQILNDRITSLSGYLESDFATINYVNTISGELSSQILMGGGSGVTYLNSLAGTINLISSNDYISFENTGNNINIGLKPQNVTIYRNSSSQITGIQKNIDFLRIYRNENDKITGVFYNNYIKKILYDLNENITGISVIFL